MLIILLEGIQKSAVRLVVLQEIEMDFIQTNPLEMDLTQIPPNAVNMGNSFSSFHVDGEEKWILCRMDLIQDAPVLRHPQREVLIRPTSPIAVFLDSPF